MAQHPLGEGAERFQGEPAAAHCARRLREQFDIMTAVDRPASIWS
ncbi:hypothetical protein [Streptomyces sp. NPDC096132]